MNPNNENPSALWEALLAFQEVEKGKDVYEVRKSRGYGTGWYYLEKGGLVSKSVVNNILKDFEKVVVLDTLGQIVAKNFI